MVPKAAFNIHSSLCMRGTHGVNYKKAHCVTYFHKNKL